MKERKVLFIMPSFGCGGVESTLLSLLEVFDTKKYETTILFLEKQGDFLERIPSNIILKKIIIPEKEKGIFYGKKNMLTTYIRKGQLWKIPSFFKYNKKRNLSENRTLNAEYFREIASSIPDLEGEYDLAIDYFGYASFTTFYLAEKVKAKKKVSWLHSILSRFHPEEFEEWYSKMDVIFACSQMVKKDFETLFPTLGNVKLFYNIINPYIIREKAKEEGGFRDSYEGIRILTVGRICHEKGIDLAAEAFKLLKKDGFNIRWYIIGGGSTDEIKRIKELFSSDKEGENFVFLGIQNNPYNYMKQCDIYVQPSRFEGYCTTTNEARIIGSPIVMTNVSGASEQIENNQTGLVCDSTAEEIYEKVKRLIMHPELMEKIKANLKYLECDTRDEISKIYELLD